MKKITFLTFLLIGFFGFSQEFPLDFSDPLDEFSDTASNASIVMDPAGCSSAGCSGAVLQIDGGSEQFSDPVQLDLITFVDLTDSSNNTITLDFYAGRAGNMLFQMANPSDGGFAVEIVSAVTPGLNSLVLDFDTATNAFPNAADPVTLDKYASVLIFVDFGEAGVQETHWVDNISGGLDGGSTAAPPGSIPTVAAPTPPQRDAAGVFSIFSNAYTNQPNVVFGAFNVGTQNINTIQVEGDDVQEVDFTAAANFLLVDWGTIVDNTSMTHFHIDYWTATTLTTGLVFNPKWSNHVGDAGETSAFELTNPVSTFGEWVSIDIPISDFNIGSGQRDALRQFILTAVGADSGSRTFFIDNIYLHNNTTLSTNEFETAQIQVSPNPTRDSWEVSGLNTTISSIEVYDILGKNVILLTPNSNEAVIDASRLLSGIYLARLTSDEGRVRTLRLVKN